MRSVLRYITGSNDASPQQQTLRALLERLASPDAHLYDVRAALVELRKRLHSHFQELSADGVPAILSVLGRFDDVNVTVTCLDLLLQLLKGTAVLEEAPADEHVVLHAALKTNTARFVQQPKQVATVVLLLRQDDYYVRKAALQLLHRLAETMAPQLQEAVLSDPTCVPQLIEVLQDRHMLVRFDAVKLLGLLASHNSQLQQLFAFHNIFPVLLHALAYLAAAAPASGAADDGVSGVGSAPGADGGDERSAANMLAGSVAPTELYMELLWTLLHDSPANQNIFRESSHCKLLVDVLSRACSYDPAVDGTPEHARPPHTAPPGMLHAGVAMGCLGLVRVLLETSAPAALDASTASTASSSGPALRTLIIRNQAALYGAGAAAVVGYIYREYPEFQPQALATLSALVRDNRELSLQWLKSNWSTFMAVFLSCLAPVVRSECLALVQGVLRGNHDCQNAVVAGLVDGLDGLGSILGALSQTVSAEVSSQACVLLQMLIDDNNAAKVRLLRARHESTAVLEFTFKVFCKTVRRARHWRAAVSQASLLATWLVNCQDAVAQFLEHPSTASTVCTFAAALDMALHDDDERAPADGGTSRVATRDATAADVHTCQALCGVVLVLCLDFHPGDEAGVPRSTLADLIVHKVGIDEVQALVDSLDGSTSLSASVVGFVAAAHGHVSARFLHVGERRRAGGGSASAATAAVGAGDASSLSASGAPAAASTSGNGAHDSAYDEVIANLRQLVMSKDQEMVALRKRAALAADAERDRAELAVLRGKLHTLTERSQAAEADASALRASNAQLAQELVASKQQLVDASSDNERLRAELTHTCAELNGVLQLNMQLERINMEKEAALESARAELVATRAAPSHVDQGAVVAPAPAATAAQVAGLEAEVSRLRVVIEKQASELEALAELQAEHDDLLLIMQEQEDELDRLRADAR